jgi:hypothetical protein
MGNRGILHDENGVLGPARWRHKNWVTCLLSFKNRHRTIMAPGRYTELFFLDEAVALAAGHRPCAECRRADFKRFAEAWRVAHNLPNTPRAGEIDEVLHPARVKRTRQQVQTSAEASSLPYGTFISLPAEPDTAWLVRGVRLHRWTHEGYIEQRTLFTGIVTVLTPEPIVRLLASGYEPNVHPSARK